MELHRRPLCILCLCFIIIILSSGEINSSRVDSHQQLGRRRRLGGPGSSPPRCIGKCERCNPCRAVHVPVPPGTSAPTEYYPEAWRCKCGNRLYMP